MTKEDFLIGINYLKNYYINSNIDTSNKGFLNVWYSAFCDFQKDNFFSIIKKYCENEENAPKNPNQLLKYAQAKNGAEVWEWLKMTNDKYPYDNVFYQNKFYQEITQDKIAYEIFKTMASESKANIFVEKTDFDFEENVVGLKVIAGYEYRKNYFVKNYNAKSGTSIKKMLANSNDEKLKLKLN